MIADLIGQYPPPDSPEKKALASWLFRRMRMGDRGWKIAVPDLVRLFLRETEFLLERADQRPSLQISPSSVAAPPPFDT